MCTKNQIAAKILDLYIYNKYIMQNPRGSCQPLRVLNKDASYLYVIFNMQLFITRTPFIVMCVCIAGDVMYVRMQ